MRKLPSKEKAMRSGNGAEHRQAGDREQQHVQTPDSAQGCSGVASGSPLEPFVEKGFDEKDDKHEYKPESDHCCHPPVVWIVKTRPQIHSVGQPETRRASDRNRDADLRGKTAFHGVEHCETFGGGRTGRSERQDNERHESNSADPVDNGENMQGARQDEIVNQDGLLAVCMAFGTAGGLSRRSNIL